jgi:asparagine synthase (glutamine-hydrolysing)
MCGVCGVVGMDGILDPSIREAIRPMTRALAHRGPDGEGYYTDAHAALGHRRLAIIDRSGGHQPMSNEDESVWIVFNGEIYNYKAIREDLITRGHSFRTVSDTETIVHAYEEFGPDCVQRLEGMFAFAVYDKRARSLFVARDRLGKKPLFYGIFGGAFHFASEMKAFRHSPAWDDALDLAALEGYLSLGYFLAPSTVYAHVHKLEPGHWLRLADGRVSIRKYWDVEEFDTDRRSSGEIVGELDGVLRHAVHERLESEVPLGAFLSGGIDSGLVVSYMAEAADRDQLITTTVGFGEAGHNELESAALTARQFNTSHHAEVVTPDLDEVLDRIVGSFDEPFADSSSVPTYYVSARARRHVTVALTGDGGDESFAGYDFRYVPHVLEARARPFLRADVSRGAAEWLGQRWPTSASLPRPLRLGTLLRNLARDSAAAYYFDLCFLKPWDARALMGSDPEAPLSESPVYDAVTAPYRRCSSSSALQRAEYADLKVYLANDVLVKVDRMSMAHGLEIRCPLLDRRVVEYAFRIPESVKMPRLQAKHVLKRLAENRLPRDVTALPKHGFTAPIGEWMRGPYAQRFRDEVLAPGSLVSSTLDVSQVRGMFDDHLAGRVDRSYALWAVWMFERWARLTNVHADAAALRLPETAT